MKAVPNVDLANLGRGWGWKLEQAQHFPHVRQVAEGRGPVAVYQEAGRLDWTAPWGGWPEHFTRVDYWPAADTFAAAIAITDRQLPRPDSPVPVLIYRPPTLTLGIHGQIEETQEELLECVAGLFARHGLSVLSLTALAADAGLKHHPELIDLAENLNIPYLTYTAETLAKLPNPTHAAVPAALAAMLAAGVKEALVAGEDCGSFTLAVARRTWVVEG